MSMIKYCSVVYKVAKEKEKTNKQKKTQQSSGVTLLKRDRKQVSMLKEIMIFDVRLNLKIHVVNVSNYGFQDKSKGTRKYFKIY